MFVACLSSKVVGILHLFILFIIVVRLLQEPSPSVSLLVYLHESHRQLPSESSPFFCRISVVAVLPFRLSCRSSSIVCYRRSSVVRQSQPPTFAFSHLFSAAFFSKRLLQSRLISETKNFLQSVAFIADTVRSLLLPSVTHPNRHNSPFCFNQQNR